MKHIREGEFLKKKRNYFTEFTYTKYRTFKHLAQHYSKFDILSLLTPGKFWLWAKKLNIVNDHYSKILKFHKINNINV